MDINRESSNLNENSDSQSSINSDSGGYKESSLCYNPSNSTFRESENMNEGDKSEVAYIKSAVTGEAIEVIDDRRFSLPLHMTLDKSSLRQRATNSENDVSARKSLSEGLHLLKSQIGSKLHNKLCKRCLFQSIQSKLTMLGIVSASNKDINVLESEFEDKSDDGSAPLKDSCDILSEFRKTSLESSKRKTLSEVDWHELTKFAQGDTFDPQSSTAKEIKRVVEEGKDDLAVALKMVQNIDLDYVVEEAEKCVHCIINSGWRVVSHWELPLWLRDNDFLWHMHRPQLPSFKECFCSMFRIHTETGNIWTHFLGLILIIIAMFVVYLSPSTVIGDFPKGWEEYIAFTSFFVGAIACLAFSWLYHTVSCHSKKASKLFSKLDYTGIACMIMGSFVPAMYYGFYCHFYEKIIYSTCIITLGLCSIIVSLWDKFATPAFRTIRAGVFLALGCSSIIPVIHIMFIHGLSKGSAQASLVWLVLMAICYIVGALLYAMRIPERFFPGRCNLLFQSHQIFHILVVIAALVHLHGCCQMALYRIKIGRENCPVL